MSKTFAIVAFLAATSTAQQVGHQKTDEHLPLSLGTCTKAGGCTDNQMGVTLDSNWRWLHKVGTSTNCYTGNSWDATLCPDPETCTTNCALDGVPAADWKGTYGVESDGKGLTMNFVTQGPYSRNVGGRTYMMDGDSKYKMFKLKNKEFTFDVDVSNMPCGLNGALYFVEMPEDGGMSSGANGNATAGGNNAAGAKYGTGYCDAQCPHDLKFIDGEANSKGWKPSPTDQNSGTGFYGTCCAEMDIWESNTAATAVTAHVCDLDGPKRCSGSECGDDASGERYQGVCDKDGCDINPYRLGNKNFFGKGSSFDVDTSKPMTVVTQFITSDGTDDGDLTEIRRLYVQDGKQIASPEFTMAGNKYDSITDKFCTDKNPVFKDQSTFEKLGGLKKMGDSMGRGMVLVMSMWDDHAQNMLWLDSSYPLDRAATEPGVARGPCATTSGVPDDVEKASPDSHVTYSNIKFGEIGSTTSGSPPAPPAPTPSTPTPAPAPTPAPGPSPSGCPGGSLQACIGLCPADPAAAYQACVKDCATRCS